MQSVYVPQPGKWSYPAEIYSPVYPPTEVKKPAIQAYKLTPLDLRYHPEDDCDLLKKAMKGLGTDEDMMIKVIANSTYAKREYMVRYYQQAYGKDLIKEIKSEISRRFLQLVLDLFKSPDVYDCENLFKAMKGAGTDDDALIEILCTKNNDQANLIKETFQNLYKQDLATWIKGETSGTYEKILIAMIGGCRSQNPEPDEEKCKKDAQELYNQGEGKLGTDESLFIKIFGARSNAELRCIWYYYNQITGHPITKAIDGEFSGNAKKALNSIYECVMDPASYFASRLYSAMHGAGTNDDKLIRIIVARNEIDLPAIKAAYKKKYNEELVDAIKSDTSGDYKNLLVAIVESRN